MKRGYVLHHRPFKESSVIVNLLIDGVGRVDAIARTGSGKRSIKSILQPFQPLLLQFSAQSESKNLALKTVTHIEAASPAIPLSSNSLYSGFYLNELLVRLLTIEHQAESLFVAYHQALIALAQSFCSSHLRYFEKALLLELGALPSLDYDVDGNNINSDGFYRLEADCGFIPVLQQSVGVFTHSRSVVPGAMLVALQKESLAVEHLNSAKGLMRFLLSPLLGNKPLLSRQLFVK
ncbi:DNA repair protein RecO [Shewanella gaetbuli]|uniref:DNA repair protein RecO n=1 Tax=Shewanella gaetbuli TaxID=220752 RepID=A0A9X1ZFI9_9GAMM|nr:DNA repair protein RecO [Shewanella gaetbuli]MCL1141429.1 DNA repair protein RecO [Shewanella gaetbuli]